MLASLLGVKRGKTRASKAKLVLVLQLIGRESGASNFNQSDDVIKQNLIFTRLSVDRGR